MNLYDFGWFLKVKVLNSYALVRHAKGEGGGGVLVFSEIISTVKDSLKFLECSFTYIPAAQKVPYNRCLCTQCPQDYSFEGYRPVKT